MANTRSNIPLSPTISLVTQSAKRCNFVDTTLKITQSNFGKYTKQNLFVRYKIGFGKWSNNILISSKQSELFTVPNASPGGTKVFVEAYSVCDDVKSSPQLFSYTTLANSISPASLSLVSQSAETNQTTVKATIKYNQVLPSAETLITCGGNKFGLDYAIENPTPTPIQAAVLYGDTAQDVYNGRNLIKFKNANINGINTTAYEDGSITCVGTTTTNYFNLTAWQEALPEPLPAGTYTFSRSRNYRYAVSARVWNQDKTKTAVFALNQNDAKTTLTTDFDIHYFTVNYAQLSAGTDINLTVCLQLEAGSVATEGGPYTNKQVIPSPSSPSLVKVVTGVQTITISDGTGATRTHTIDLGNIELCKLGNYQDYIYKKDGTWFVHKEIRAVLLPPCKEMNNDESYAGWTDLPDLTDDLNNPNTDTNLSDLTVWASDVSTQDDGELKFGVNGSTLYLVPTPDKPFGRYKQSKWKTDYAETRFKLYYGIKNENNWTDKAILDQDVIDQLDALLNVKLFAGHNDIVVSTSATDRTRLPAYLEISALVNYGTPDTVVHARYGYRGKNLLNLKTLDVTAVGKTEYYTTIDENTIEYSTEARIVTTDIVEFYIYKMQLEPNTTYTFSAKFKVIDGTPGKNTGAIRVKYYSDNEPSENYSPVSTNGSVTFTTGANGKIGLLFYNYTETTGKINYVKTRWFDIQVEKGDHKTAFEPYLASPSNWFVVGTNSATENFDLRNLDNSQSVIVQTNTIENTGACSSKYGELVFQSLVPIARPIYNAFIQTDNGRYVSVVVPYAQPDAGRFKAIETYYSYQVDNQTWSEWVECDNCTTGTINIQNVPYGSKLCIRSYSIGDNLKGRTAISCVTVSEKTADDTPYTGDVFLVEPICHSLQYLSTLICQEWFAIKDGDRTIYTNEEHKQACGGDEFDPTLHSILSRVYRFFGAVWCLICNGANNDLNYYKAGATDNVLISAGDDKYSKWTAPDLEIIKDSKNVATSGAIRKAIDKFVNTVYHYVGNYDYLVSNVSALASLNDVVKGRKALVEKREYVYDGTTWVAGDLRDFSDFNLIHINNSSPFPSYIDNGKAIDVPAGSGWYWYNNKWNQLDASSSQYQTTLNDLLKRKLLTTQSANEPNIQFAVLNRLPNGFVATPPRPTNKTIYFITEDI